MAVRGYVLIEAEVGKANAVGEAVRAVKHTDAELLPPAESRKLDEIKQRAIDSRGPIRERVELTLPYGPQVFEVYIEPVPAHDGKTNGLIGSVTRC